MKLDESTTEILKNFQTINNSIQISEGDTTITMASSETVLARAKFPIQFPMTFCIHDMARFLSVAKMFKEGEIDFSDSYLTFRDGKKKVRYSFCDPDVITLPKKPPAMFPKQDQFFQFTLTASMIDEALSGMNVLKHSAIAIIGDGDTLSIETVTNVNSDKFSMDIGETNHTFKFIFEASKLNFLPRDYTVTLSRKRHMHLQSDGLEYWVAGGKDSTITE